MCVQSNLCTSSASWPLATLFPGSFFPLCWNKFILWHIFPFYHRLNSKRCIMINFALFSRFCCDPPPLSRHVIPLKLSREIFMFSKSTSLPCFMANWWCRASCHKLINWVEHDSILFTQRQTFFSFSLFVFAHRPSWQVWSESLGRHRPKRQLSSTPNLLLHHHSSTSTSRPSWEVSSSSSSITSNR